MMTWFNALISAMGLLHSYSLQACYIHLLGILSLNVSISLLTTLTLPSDCPGHYIGVFHLSGFPTRCSILTWELLV